MNKYLSFTLGTAIAAGTIIAGCGGDTVSVDNLFGDASATQDATVADTGAPDQVAPVMDAGNDAASGCTGTLSMCSGACVDTTSDGDNCGGCGNTCPTGQVCSLGVCASVCTNGTSACGNDCVTLLTDPSNCGTCGNVCAGGLVCSKGSCATTCAAGLTSCTVGANGGGSATGGGSSGDAGDAGSPTGVSCVDVTSDDANCGACGAACPSGQVCSNGSCAVTCQAGYVQCGSTCFDPTNDPTHCGATAGCGADGGIAGTACASGQVCSAGQCVTTCQAGLVDCNGGCVDPKTDNAFCGAAGTCDGTAGNSKGVICAPGTICTGNGTCQANCQTDEVLCGNTCINPKNNSTFCGAVGKCDGTAGNGKGTTCAAGQLCSNGACAATCSTGQVVCSNTCVDPLTDPNHCGAKAGCTGGAVCTNGQVCNNGTCATSCQPDEVLCGTTCVNPLTNPGFCGAAGKCDGTAGNGKGTACGTGQVCSNGTCALTCPANTIDCGGTCVDPLTNETYCGAQGSCDGTANNGAGTMCGTGTVCTNGSCGTTCGAGLSICTNACVNEQVDPAHCGSCTACAAEANVATDVCRSGNCAVGTCNAGTADCNGTFTDGCEVATATDANNCGACGHICPTNLPYCTAGVCVQKRSVAVVGAPVGATWGPEVVSYLQATNKFRAVTYVDAQQSTPSVATLETYDAVVVFSDYGFNDANALGNNLADYYDAGGHVVLAMFAIAEAPVGGRFGTQANGYIFMGSSFSETNTQATLGAISEPASPLLAGVTSLTCMNCYRAARGTLVNGGTVTASWSDGSPLIVHGMVGGRDRVDVNFYPPSIHSRADFVDGSYAAILSNALAH